MKRQKNIGKGWADHVDRTAGEKYENQSSTINLKVGQVWTGQGKYGKMNECATDQTVQGLMRLVTSLQLYLLPIVEN